MQYNLTPLKNETLKQFFDRNKNVKTEKELKKIFIENIKKLKNENADICK